MARRYVDQPSPRAGSLRHRDLALDRHGCAVTRLAEARAVFADLGAGPQLALAGGEAAGTERPA
jgi:hypothetical protein